MKTKELIRNFEYVMVGLGYRLVCVILRIAGYVAGFTTAFVKGFKTGVKKGVEEWKTTVKK